MATLLLTALGTAVGGPIGGAIGAIIGQQADALLLKPAPRQGPRLSDLSVQTSTYGASIPQLFGRVRVTGSVIWSTDLVETRRTQGGGKGRASTETYNYSASFAVLLSARRISRVGRIWADGKLLRGAAGDLKTEVTALRIHSGDADQSPDPLIVAAEGGDAPAYRGSAYAVFETMQLAEYGNRLPSLSFEVFADETPVEATATIATLAGAAVVADPGPAPLGLSATGGSVRAVAEVVQGAWPMIVRDDGRVRLATVPRPSPAPAPDDLGARTDNNRVARIALDIAPLDSGAAALTLAYLDDARDYQQGLQRARREGPGRLEERIDLPATLAATDALGLAEAALSRMSTERVRATINLPWRRIDLRPGDSFTLDGIVWRVVEMRFERMCVRLDLARSDHSPTATATAAPGRAVSEVDAPHGPTQLVVVDLPPLSDVVATQPQVAVFAGGASPGWRRAALFLSSDGATFDPVGSTALPAVFGRTLTALDPASALLIDRVNSVEVALDTPNGLLTNADGAAMLAGANRAMIGDELVQFARAEDLGSGRWRLRELWRGRGGTEDAIVAHPPGSGFIIIDSDTAAILPPERVQPGASVMAAGIGDVEPWPRATVARVGRALWPLSPCGLRWERDESGGIVVTWVRRSRAGWAWRDGVDAPLAEETEAWRVSVGDTLFEVASAEFVVTAAMQAAAGAAVTVAVRQIGGFAESPAASITIPLA